MSRRWQWRSCTASVFSSSDAEQKPRWIIFYINNYLLVWEGLCRIVAQTLLSQHPVPAPVNNERATAGKKKCGKKCSVTEAGVQHAEPGPPLLAGAVLGWLGAQLQYNGRCTKDCAGPRPWHGFRGTVGLDMSFPQKCKMTAGHFYSFEIASV